MISVPTLDEKLAFFRSCTPGEIKDLVSAVIPEEMVHLLPVSYLDFLSSEDKTLCFRACLICWALTGCMVPREMQLRTVVADFHGQYTLISAGTGSGKTLPIALCIHLDDPSEHRINITVSPLKRLQVTQESDFNTRFHIPTLVVNDDTTTENGMWNVNVYNPATRKFGPIRHFIVTVEQLFKSPAGHFGRFATLIRKQPHFLRHILRVFVDEAHFIHTAGQPLYGLPAFRPAWGRLGELNKLLPNHVRWKAFSATFPPHILDTVTKAILKTNYVSIHVTSNRPNTVYATHQVHEKIGNLRNYECFIHGPTFDFDKQPHVLIFVDDKNLTCRIAQHLDSYLPPEYRGRGVVRHYHSAMSEKYLQLTHEEFVKENGKCRVLVSTSGQSVGVDFPNVKIVCTVGLPTTLVDGLQRAGRAARSANQTALFVVFYEEFVTGIKESEFTGDVQDPDRPQNNLQKDSRRQERVPLSAVRLVNSTGCLRKFFSDYLGDKSSEALAFTGSFCCDRHDNGFSLEAELPGYIYRGAVTISTEPKTQNRYRQKWERPALDRLLIDWVASEAETDKLLRSPYDILSRSQRDKLQRTPFTAITSPASIRSILNESVEWEQEWGGKIFQIICDYQPIRTPKPTKKK